MARVPRIDLPGIAQHIVQRGNDRHASFADEADYLHYRQELGEAAAKHDCLLHAYVLMTNHVHPHVLGTGLPVANAGRAGLPNRQVCILTTCL